jgi:HEAT repeat protein
LRDETNTSAALSIGRIGGKAALPVLFRAVREPEPEVLRSAILGIRRVTGKCFVEDPYAPVPEAERDAVRARYREWWMENPTGRYWRRKSAAAAGESGMRSLVQYVIPWIREDDPAMRAAVLDAMVRLRGEPAWRDLPTETAEEREAALRSAFEALAEKR